MKPRPRDRVEEIFKMGEGDTAEQDIFSDNYLAKLKKVVKESLMGESYSEFQRDDKGAKDVDKKDDLTETKDCNTEACKIDAKMSQWENSGTCYNQITTSNPKPCGGLQKQIRSYTPPENGGKDLPITEKNLLEQIVDCETKCADIDGRFTDWVDDKSNNCYSSQSDTSQIITCGNGYKKQVRTYIPATGKGKKLRDQRQDIKKRDWERDQGRILKNTNKR